MFSPRRSFIVDTVLFLTALVVIFGIFRVLEPRFDNVLHRPVGEKEWQSHNYPFQVGLPAGAYEVSLVMKLRFPHYTRFQFIPDNCIDGISVNGNQLSEDLFPFCNYWFGEVLDLSPYLQPGDNSFLFTVGNDGGTSKVHIFTANRDPLLIFLHGLFMFAIGVYIWRLARRVAKSRSERILWVTFVVGIYLRMYYYFITLAGIREVDMQAHLDYINHLLANSFSLPLSSGGWAFYHPPLYYYISASWMALGDLLGWAEHVLVRDLQVVGLFLSVGTFAFIFWMCVRLFPKVEQSGERLFFMLLLGLQPGLIFLAARINNDVLYQFFAFAALAFILLWWQEAKVKYWLLCIAAIALGLLTKSNMLLLLPVAYICLLLRRSVSLKSKLQLGIVGIMILILSTGWFYGLRYMSDGDEFAMQNLHEMSDELILDTSLHTLVEFNPVRLVEDPYNRLWEPHGGRDYFWEYWMRSAFFGRFSFEGILTPIASAILLFASLLVPLMLIGFYRCIRYRWYEMLPMWSCAVILLVGHVAYRQYAPFSPSQDFRYSIPVLVPFALFLITSMSNVQSKWWKYLWQSVVMLLLFCCAAFIILMPITQ